VVHALAYWGRLTTNKQTGRIAVATQYAGIMQIFEYKDNAVNLINENILFLADYEEKFGNFFKTPDTRWGYLCIDSDDKYIYALYSGVFERDGGGFLGKEIHVFDWNCSFLGILKTNSRLTDICIDDNGNIYGYDYDKGDIVVCSNVKKMIVSPL
jgi:hypothetical protein